MNDTHQLQWHYLKKISNMQICKSAVKRGFRSKKWVQTEFSTHFFLKSEFNLSLVSLLENFFKSEFNLSLNSLFMKKWVQTQCGLTFHEKVRINSDWTHFFWKSETKLRLVSLFILYFFHDFFFIKKNCQNENPTNQNFQKVFCQKF